MSEKTRIVIAGGVAGGASAAARARRLSEEAEIIVLERGEYVSFANCGLPYHIGGTISDRNRLLVQTPQTLYANLRLDVRTRTEAVRIDRERKEVIARNVESGEEQAIRYDRLILSPGAEPIRPPIPGSEDPRVRTLRSMQDMDEIVALLESDTSGRALVIGGGYIGLEIAEALRHRDMEVTLVELASCVMGAVDPEMANPVHQEILRNGVDLRLDTSVTSFEDSGDTLTAHLSTGEALECGLVLMAIGVRPDVSLARDAGLKIGDRGGIVVDEHMRTSDPDVFAVGDAVEVTEFVGGGTAHIPLAGPANRQGRIAADNALGRSSSYNRTQGTGICKVFDLAVGMTGLNEKCLKRDGIPYEKIYIHPASHASYYPGATQMSLKLLFDPGEGRILGAQAVGANGVDKRIDVLATAIRAGMTVYDLEELELSYAPPYGSAKDPVNYAGFVASNALRGDVALCHTEDFLDPSDSQIMLDVRTAPEVAAGTIPGSVAIPLQELRERIGELPRGKEILVFCQVGLRGYLACRILRQKGFACRNLTGGFKTYRMATGHLDAPSAPDRKEVTDDSGTTDEVSAAAVSAGVTPVKTVDATALQCPGPIMRTAEELKEIAQGEAIEVISTDSGFASDIGPWCHSTGNTLVELTSENGRYRALIAKGAPRPEHAPAHTPSKHKTIVVFSSDFDKAVAAFVIANGAAAMGSEVTMFFTFWGLNILRKPEGARVSKNVIEKMFGWMMPRGADKLSLSKMNMGGMGLSMIKGIMRKKNVPSLPEFIESARKSGVRLVACTMSMDLMGIKREELIEGVEEGGVAMYLDRAEAGNVNLFI
ncbi:MAG: DsrE/DsrF/DrsH-like family protein [Armatimonadetes bacterium]|nr:DsrE/DsrF/DrsH-like family protein [Armatimonadota bacterium]